MYKLQQITYHKAHTDGMYSLNATVTVTSMNSLSLNMLKYYTVPLPLPLQFIKNFNLYGPIWAPGLSRFKCSECEMMCVSTVNGAFGRHFRICLIQYVHENVW